jgi:hypothetical protein
MSFQLIVPSIVETQCTGFFGAVEKRFRGSLYRIEFWPSGASLTKDGTKLRSWDDLPKSVQADALAGKTALIPK